mmetsp:Transcript_18228/g.30201  ORF Transcript_18228/g.30201 Transcript_18228/m.30201 type:complete len:83 (+) Transcript_18228:90-338(+)
MGGSIGMCYASGQSGPRGGACNFNFTYEEEAGGKKEAKTVCVLFDFDGTIGNTNKAAMEILVVLRRKRQCGCERMQGTHSNI